MKLIAYLYAGAGMAAAGAGAFIAYRVWQGGSTVADAVAELGDKVNPTSPNNVAAVAANKVVQAVTGEPEASLGVKIWEWTHPGAVAAEKKITDPTLIPRPAAGATPRAGDAVDLGAYNYALPAETLNGVNSSPFWYGAP